MVSYVNQVRFKGDMVRSMAAPAPGRWVKVGIGTGSQERNRARSARGGGMLLLGEGVFLDETT